MPALPGLGISKSQVDAAGRRVRKCAEQSLVPATEDMAVVEGYREWHLSAVLAIQERLTYHFFHEREGPTEPLTIAARPKTSDAIVKKLKRARIALSRMQDITGARVVVLDLETQEAALSAVNELFGDAVMKEPKDTREEGDQWGYRAIHVMVMQDSRIAEIQIRTRTQDIWAQTVERLDESRGTDLKHGRGPVHWIQWLHALSDALRRFDLGEPLELPPMPADDEEENEEA